MHCTVRNIICHIVSCTVVRFSHVYSNAHYHRRVKMFTQNFMTKITNFLRCLHTKLQGVSIRAPPLVAHPSRWGHLVLSGVQWEIPKGDEIALTCTSRDPSEEFETDAQLLQILDKVRKCLEISYISTILAD
ncbi:hypothetical protein MPTK2_7g11750 [Marchantia polymorpha subsp. ruderalis]